jgi:DNA-binding MarR family transcriptional regulator
MATSTRQKAAAIPPDHVLVLEDFLPYRLSVVATIVSQGFARLYSERFGISIPEWRVVAMLGQHRTLTSKGVAERTLMHKTMVSRAVTDLEHHGLLSRQINRADKREAFLTLTETGHRVYAEIVPLARDYTARLTAHLSDQDRAAFDRVMTMLHERSGIVFAVERTNGDTE